MEINRNLHSNVEWYNAEIHIDEVRRVVAKSKCNRAVGVDNLPNGTLKNEQSVHFLHIFFNKLFMTGLTPSLWRVAILKPIPKGSTT